MSKDFYTQFILPYAGIIIKICRAYTDNEEDFQDYYQEVCLQLWKSRDNFKGDSKWSTWVYRISLNVSLSLLRKDKKLNKKKVELPEVETSSKQDSDPFNNEALKLLYQAIKQLPETDRAIILLYLDEKSYQEIAEIIGLSANNIGVKITRIKKKLKTLLDGKIY
ncbi:RNA polymerase sigma factor [Christiangramia forsetii]|uniref:RNA polymerase ECF-type sigma factor n=2 Tax=Christiangramia forsetii TaxID=411153 RepID=A0LXS0_CHRFK|nr:sigma-70 family RNA polymerase sigma factor [Christiangramia forsetii]GGG36093.1 DNA-directed RNA polymerase sigma-70 factor [Christiangramia forsetii]CAL65165.1 RNA polymerase ECF-type sigma factor [Christiangramia forsetii KT0803]